MDVCKALEHVLWIGGGPQAGKTTLSRLLAGKYDLKIYNLDWHGARDHRSRSGPAAMAFERLSMDERWALPSVPELVERSIAIWEELFALVTADLLALPQARAIVAEGPGAFPWCVAPLISSSQQAIFLVPTREHRNRVAGDRWGADQAERFPGIAERERALAKLRERDALVDKRIVTSCAELGLRCVTVDGTLNLDRSLALLEEQFGDFLPPIPNV